MSFGESYFYSLHYQVPSALLELEPNIQLISEDFTDVDLSFSGLIWFHLAPGATIAAQTATIRKCLPHGKLVIMSDLPSDLEALAAFSIMAKAYCNTHSGMSVLANVASVVLQGGIWIGEAIMHRLLENQVPAQDIAKVVNTKWDNILTTREREVAVMVANGLPNRVIAEKMSITERTVKAHVGAVLEKLGLKSRLQLALLVKES
ncbi:response regulator transcription factor [Undibacterium cyanobacteriorum]|uniref:Response regulator transcription factor n=1 Tax=Undibacterium cyanobacteriorum TaxID=3073561 RepID=A0ABY9RE11_9BURK|nr:response regulator transcription factor [Undibacterium sp. 20NA77.5]WMW79457.1 response regulator transcription factor [Undibacterium sp. 20NA77.5]